MEDVDPPGSDHLLHVPLLCHSCPDPSYNDQTSIRVINSLTRPPSPYDMTMCPSMASPTYYQSSDASCLLGQETPQKSGNLAFHLR